MMNGTVAVNTCASCNNQCLSYLFKASEIEAFGKGGTRSIQYKKGETILKQGTFASHLLFLKAGLVKLVLESPNSKETILQLSNSGTYICLSTLYMDDYFPFTVVALTDCEVCLIKRDIFKQQLQKNIKATEYVLKWHSKECLYLYRKMSVQGTRNNHGKLAETLLYISSIEYKTENASKYLSRNDLADLASISLESTNKILNELKNDLIIKIKNDGIAINNYELLERLSRIG